MTLTNKMKAGKELRRKARNRNRKKRRQYEKQCFNHRMTPSDSAQRCPYCGEQPVLVSGGELFNNAQLATKAYHLCKPCGAWVGCYPDTIKPMGILAKPHLRKLRKQLHDLFDPLWQDAECPTLARHQAYTALAEAMGLEPSVCHFGMFDDRQCEQALAVVEELRSRAQFNNRSCDYQRYNLDSTRGDKCKTPRSGNRRV